MLVCFCSCAMASTNQEEKANSARLSRLLVDKGTEAFTNTFNAIHPPVSLLSAQHLQGDRHDASRAELEPKSKKPKEGTFVFSCYFRRVLRLI